MTLLGAVSLAMGETVTESKVDISFLGSPNLDNIGLEFTSWNNGGTVGPNFSSTDDGMTYTNWSRGLAKKDLAIDLASDPTATYVITYVVATSTADCNSVLLLGGDQGSLAFGHSYNTGGGYHTGYTTNNAVTANQMTVLNNNTGSAQCATAFSQDSIVSTSGETPAGSASPVTFTVTLKCDTMTVNFAGGDKSLTTTYTLADNLQVFNKLGIIMDGKNNPTAKSLSVTKSYNQDTWTVAEGDATSANWVDKGWAAEYSNFTVSLGENVTTGTITIGGSEEKSRDVYVNNLTVSGGALTLQIEDGSSFQAGNKTIADGASLAYAGAGKLILAENMTLQSDYSVISGLTGTLEVTGAHTLKVGVTRSELPAAEQTGKNGDYGKDMGFDGLNASKIILSNGGKLDFTGTHDFTNTFELNGGELHARDGLNGALAYTFSGKITVSGTNNILSSEWDKHFAIAGGIDGAGSLEISGATNQWATNAIFDVTSTIANEGGINVTHKAIINVQGSGQISAPITLNNGTTLNVAKNAHLGSGAVTVKDGATLALSGNYNFNGNTPITFSSGSTLEVQDGVHVNLQQSGLEIGNLKIGNKPTTGLTVSVYQDASVKGTLTMTGSTSSIGFVQYKSLGLANGILTATASTNTSDIQTTGGTITGTNGTVTSTAAGSAVKFNNMALAFNYSGTTAYDFASTVSGTTDITKTGTGTVKFSHGSALNIVTVSDGKLELAAPTASTATDTRTTDTTTTASTAAYSIAKDSSVASGAELAVDSGATLSLAGKLTVNGTVGLGSGSGVVKADGGSITLGENGSITGSNVTIATLKATGTGTTTDTPAEGTRGTYGAGETTETTATLSGVTISNSGITKTEGATDASISNADITIAAGTTKFAMSGFEISDSKITNNSDQFTLDLSDVVLSSGNEVVSKNSSLTLGADDVTFGSITPGDPAPDGKNTLALTYTVTDAAALTLTGVLDLTVGDDLVLKLQAWGCSTPIETVNIKFAGADGVAVSVADNLTVNLINPENAVYTFTEGAAMGNNSISFKVNPVIPEPATGVLSMLALAALAARRRRKH